MATSHVVVCTNVGLVANENCCMFYAWETKHLTTWCRKVLSVHARQLYNIVKCVCRGRLLQPLQEYLTLSSWMTAALAIVRMPV